jgi:hypothetical protein
MKDDSIVPEVAFEPMWQSRILNDFFKSIFPQSGLQCDVYARIDGACKQRLQGGHGIKWNR